MVLYPSSAHGLPVWQLFSSLTSPIQLLRNCMLDLKKIVRDKVIMVPYKWFIFSARSSQGSIKGKANKIVEEGPSFDKLGLQSRWLEQ